MFESQRMDLLNEISLSRSSGLKQVSSTMSVKNNASETVMKERRCWRIEQFTVADLPFLNVQLSEEAKFQAQNAEILNQIALKTAGFLETTPAKPRDIVSVLVNITSDITTEDSFVQISGNSIKILGGNEQTGTIVITYVSTSGETKTETIEYNGNAVSFSDVDTSKPYSVRLTSEYDLTEQASLDASGNVVLPPLSEIDVPGKAISNEPPTVKTEAKDEYSGKIAKILHTTLKENETISNVYLNIYENIKSILNQTFSTLSINDDSYDSYLTNYFSSNEERSSTEKLITGLQLKKPYSVIGNIDSGLTSSATLTLGSISSFPPEPENLVRRSIAYTDGNGTSQTVYSPSREISNVDTTKNISGLDTIDAKVASEAIVNSSFHLLNFPSDWCSGGTITYIDPANVEQTIDFTDAASVGTIAIKEGTIPEVIANATVSITTTVENYDILRYRLGDEEPWKVWFHGEEFPTEFYSNTCQIECASISSMSNDQDFIKFYHNGSIKIDNILSDYAYFLWFKYPTRLTESLQDTRSFDGADGAEWNLSEIASNVVEAFRVSKALNGTTIPFSNFIIGSYKPKYTVSKAGRGEWFVVFIQDGDYKIVENIKEGTITFTSNYLTEEIRRLVIGDYVNYYPYYIVSGDTESDWTFDLSSLTVGDMVLFCPHSTSKYYGMTEGRFAIKTLTVDDNLKSYRIHLKNSSIENMAAYKINGFSSLDNNITYSKGYHQVKSSYLKTSSVYRIHGMGLDGNELVKYYYLPSSYTAAIYDFRYKEIDLIEEITIGDEHEKVNFEFTSLPYFDAEGTTVDYIIRAPTHYDYDLDSSSQYSDYKSFIFPAGEHTRYDGIFVGDDTSAEGWQTTSSPSWRTIAFASTITTEKSYLMYSYYDLNNNLQSGNYGNSSENITFSNINPQRNDYQFRRSNFADGYLRTKTTITVNKSGHASYATYTDTSGVGQTIVKTEAEKPYSFDIRYGSTYSIIEVDQIDIKNQCVITPNRLSIPANIISKGVLNVVYKDASGNTQTLTLNAPNIARIIENLQITGYSLRNIYENDITNDSSVQTNIGYLTLPKNTFDNGKIVIEVNGNRHETNDVSNDFIIENVDSMDAYSAYITRDYDITNQVQINEDGTVVVPKAADLTLPLNIISINGIRVSKSEV